MVVGRGSRDQVDRGLHQDGILAVGKSLWQRKKESGNEAVIGFFSKLW